MSAQPDSSLLPFLLDIGGEGRHHGAWNLNPSRTKTIGPQRGQPIPQLILGRADNLPFQDHSIEQILVERTPLLAPALAEIARVISPRGTITLRHTLSPLSNPHALAETILPGVRSRRTHEHGSVLWQETVFAVGEGSQ